jgi:hypothetical protein
MGLDRLIRTCVAIAASVTDDLLVDVEHESFASYDGDGAITYSAAVTRRAFVEQKGNNLRWRVGLELIDASLLTFVGNVTVDNRDRITLPNGSQPPILEVLGVVDPAGGTYYTQVTCGRPERGVTAT